MTEKRDIKEQLTAVDSSGLEQERRKAQKQAARAEAQKFRHERAVYLLAEQGAIDLFARCVAVFAEMGHLWAVPRSNEAESEIVAAAQAVVEEAKAMATHEGRDASSLSESAHGECYLLVNEEISGRYAGTVRAEAGFWYRDSRGFLEPFQVGTLAYRLPSEEMHPADRLPPGGPG